MVDVEIRRPEAALESEPPGHHAPWDAAPRGRALSSFTATLRSVLLEPHAFFHGLTPGQVPRAVSFAGWVLGVPLVAQLVWLWALAGTRAGALVPPAIRANFTDVGVLVRLSAVLSLALLLGVVYLVAAYQAASSIASGRRADLAATVRGTCFGFAPMVLALVPLVGPLLGLMWSLVVHAIALRELHGLRRLHSAAAVVLPFVLIAVHWWVRAR